MLKRQLLPAFLYTILTTLLLGLAYPLAITAISQLLFRDKANGSLILRNGQLIGSHLLGQSFTGAGYFHSRPSSAGTGYDAANSSGSNLGPTSTSLRDTVLQRASAERIPNSTTEIPIDLVTASASGLDPDLSPAAALYQVPRIAAERHLPVTRVEQLVQEHTTPRQFGLLGEPRVNVVELNVALNQLAPANH